MVAVLTRCKDTHYFDQQVVQTQKLYACKAIINNREE